MAEPARKKRRTSPIPSSFSSQEAPPQDLGASSIRDSEFFQNASRWNLEQDYERRPRKRKTEQESQRLPIKTAEGYIEHLAPVLEQDEADGSSDQLEGETPDTVLSDDGGEDVKPQVPRQQRILQAKEDLARMAALLNEDPEEHLGSLKKLAEITSSEIHLITKLGLATQLAVYKDIIPGYRIRPASEDEMKGKISKDVRKLRNFEQAIVKGYQRYVSELGRIAALRKPDSSEATASLSTVAISCACNLVTSVPHFNFRGELLRILVNKLGSKHRDSDFDACCSAIERLFGEDDEGNASLEAVALLAKMVKAKNFRIDERVLNLFLHLRLLTEFSQKASTTKIDREESTADMRDKKRKQKREFRNKKERKILKERKGIEKEMEEADAQVSHEHRDKMQAETLKLVFVVYFRILKARTPSLMGPVLEGLVKYAHLINQDFFGDLLESLKDLIRDSVSQPGEDDEAQPASEGEDDPSRNLARESLLCIITAFALLEGQDGTTVATTLNLDLSFFISHLYQTLYPASLNADIELSSKSLHLPDPNSPTSPLPSTKSKVNVHTTIVLLLRSLHSVLLPQNARSTPPLRLAAFTKQILTCTLQMPEKSSMAMLGLLTQVMKTHKKKIAALWNSEERKGDGVFDPLSETVERSNPFAATAWEGELLRLHYAPAVRDGAGGLERLVAE